MIFGEELPLLVTQLLAGLQLISNEELPPGERRGGTGRKITAEKGTAFLNPNTLKHLILLTQGCLTLNRN